MAESAQHRLNIVAKACAILLSVLCLAKGAVYDSTIAFALIATLPMLWFALRETKQVHGQLKRLGIVFFSAILAICVLQWIFPPTGETAALWQELSAISGGDSNATFTLDKAAWLQSVGRTIFLLVIFVLALCIGSTEASARHFLETLLMSGAVCVTLTFSMATSEGVPMTTFYSYSHGFVNPNNAATYMGVMLLIALAHVFRFIKIPPKAFYKIFLEFIDTLSMPIILKGCFLLFALLLAMAGLFMTGSRGGIIVTFLSSALLCVTILFKMNLQSEIRKGIMITAGIVMALISFWIFLNFGQVALNKLTMQGADANSRFDIYAATLPMIAHHPILGSGIGSFSGAFQAYRPHTISSDGIIDKAHNSYLEFAAEMGVPALALLLVVIGIIAYALYRGIREHKEYYVLPTLGLSVLTLGALHSLVDFPLQIPAIAALFIAIVTVCLSQNERPFCVPIEKPPEPTKRVRTRTKRARKEI
ncbi:MAG: O-antigen ligase family protein [Rickettsiales bacterium]